VSVLGLTHALLKHEQLLVHAVIVSRWQARKRNWLLSQYLLQLWHVGCSSNGHGHWRQRQAPAGLAHGATSQCALSFRLERELMLCFVAFHLANTANDLQHRGDHVKQD